VRANDNIDASDTTELDFKTRMKPVSTYDGEQSTCFFLEVAISKRSQSNSQIAVLRLGATGLPVFVDYLALGG
jgi:hypothetical protein